MTGTERDPPRPAGAGKPYLDSNEVVERLGISKSTLYAYVSRGLIRSEPVPESPRTRRYRTDDVERLLSRQRLRSDPERTRSNAATWSAPAPESTVSLISDEHLYYRNHDAIDLTRNQSFEEVIALLWLNDLTATLPASDSHSETVRHDAVHRTRKLVETLDTLAQIQAVLPVMEQLEAASYDFRPETTQRIGIDILQVFTAILVGAGGSSGIARTLQAHWAPGQSEVMRVIDAALILSADHELDVSTLTVRCIASARAPLHSAITGGISALRGQKLGGTTLQVEAMLREIESPEDAYDSLRRRLERGESLAGFGHDLYPNGDPRAQLLIELMQDALGGSKTLEIADATCRAAADLLGVQPNLEFSLMMLCRAINLPSGSALSLMALGRIAGWVAHAMEEYERDALIRPRARYIGPNTPETEQHSSQR